MNAALRKIAKGQEGKAFKMLSSNGVAAVDEGVAGELKKMHPPLDAELVLPHPATPS